MAGEDDLLRRVRAALQAYDEAALAALASRGLLRRARKDLEKGAPDHAVVGEVVEVRLEGERVRIGEEGPRRWTCSCPAREVCRHLLAAILYLQQETDAPVEEAAPEALEAELLAIDVDAMVAWGTKRVLRDAVAVLADNPQIDIDVSQTVRVFFAESLVEVRFFPGTGLDGALTMARTADPRHLVIAALLAFQQSRGATHDLESGPDVLEEAKGAPRSRAEVLTASRAVVEVMAGAGLVHVGEDVQDRLLTLSISALGVNLPRLALELRRAADEVALLVTRHAKADETRLFAEVARINALVTAIERAGAAAPAELIGWYRTRYTEIGTVELTGLGAWTWRTGSGFAGLTVLFREAVSGEWLTWSEARPKQYGGVPSAARRYLAGGPWEGMPSPSRASRSRFKLFHAKKNPAGRLSTSGKASALVTGSSDVSGLDLGARRFGDFELLRDYLERTRPAGLSRPDPLRGLVIVTPAGFLERTFDELEQRLLWTVEDEKGRPLQLVLEQAEGSAAALKHAESLDPAGTWGVLGRASLRGGALVMAPFTFYRGDELLNLGLDAAPAAQQAPAPAAPPPAFEGEHEEEEEEVPVDHASLRRIRSLESILEELAESGRTTLDEARRARLRSTATSLESAGLPILAKAARRLAEAPPEEVPARLLAGRYLTGLHRSLVA